MRRLTLALSIVAAWLFTVGGAAATTPAKPGTPAKPAASAPADIGPAEGVNDADDSEEDDIVVEDEDTSAEAAKPAGTKPAQPSTKPAAGAGTKQP